MSPLELIKKGILENDLEKVAQGYNALTGEQISTNGTADSEPAESNSEPEQVSPSMPVRSADLDFTTPAKKQPKSSHGKKEKVVAGENQFVDDGSEFKGEEFETPDLQLTPRRSPAQLVEVKCHVCGQAETINPAYKVGTFHRCGRCLGQ